MEKSCLSTNWFFPTILMIELLYQNHGVFPAGACHYMSIIWQSCSIFTKLCSNYIFCSLMRPPLKKLWLLCVGCVGSQFPVIKLATFLSFLLFLRTSPSTGIWWFDKDIQFKNISLLQISLKLFHFHIGERKVSVLLNVSLRKRLCNRDLGVKLSL